jgi:hypothetical protein
MEADYQRLFNEIYTAAGPKEQLAFYDELIRLADSNKDIEVAYNARREYVALACEQGFPEKGIVSFSWCLAQFDKNQELDEPHGLIWQYKVILELIPIFDTVSREQIVRLQEDMAKRLASMNYSERTAHYYRSWNLMRMGEYDQALEFQKTYLAMNRDGMSDCQACERDRQIELLSRMHDDEQALKFAQPIIDCDMVCGEVPEFTNAHIVRSMVRLGQEEAAAERAEHGYGLVARERKYLGTIGDLLLITIRNRDLDKGMRRAVKHLPWAAESAAGELKFRFFTAVALLLEAYSKEKKVKKKIKIPAELSCHRDDDTYDVWELSKWFGEESAKLAKRFNERNGNSRYDQLISDCREIANVR